MDVDIRLLGQVEVVVDNRVLDLGGVRPRRLATALLLNPNVVVATEQLIDALWDEAPLTARQQIHNVVSQLRRLLADVAGVDVVSTDVGYHIAVDADWIDLTRFRTLVRQAAGSRSLFGRTPSAPHLESALRLWRGPALSGLDNLYFTSVAARLEEERLAAVESLLAVRLQTGDDGAVIAEATELVARHPLRENLRATLMRALYRAGRQTDALTVYEHGRRVLAEEFGLDPGEDLKALHQDILRGRPAREVVLADDNGASTTQAANRRDERADPVPPGHCFLPHDTSDFSGRDRELSRLAATIGRPESTSLVISALNGMGGVGKTALAVRFAHRVAGAFPDGQFFVDLRGFTADVDPLAVEDALEILLRQCEVPGELIPPDLDSRAAMWRAKMAGKRAIVMLDNAVDAVQTRPLLPGASGPLVIVTSRRRLSTLEGATAIQLDVMPVEDAVELFAKVAGPERADWSEADVARVVELCGRLPLAVRIAASRFRDRSSWTIADLEDRLKDQNQRARFLDSGERSVSAVIALSYRYLSDDHRRVFRLMSAHPGPDFTPPLAAAVARTSVEHAQEILESLFDDNLVLQDSPGRYSFHDLVRDCAARLSAENDSAAARQEAAARLADYHLQCLATWCEPLAKGPFRYRPYIEYPVDGIAPPLSGGHAAGLLMQERANLLAVARSAVSRQESPQRARHLIRALLPFLRVTNYPSGSLELLEFAVAAAEAEGDERGTAVSLMAVADVYQERHAPAVAEEKLKAAVAISRGMGDLSTVMCQMNDLGRLKLGTECFDEAERYFRSGLDIGGGESDREVDAALKTNLGIVYEKFGRYADSLAHFRLALDAFLTCGMPVAASNVLVNIGLVLSHDHRFAEAVEHFVRVTNADAGDTHHHGVGAAEAGLCVAYRAQGNLPAAFEAGRRGLDLARKHRLPDVECEALAALGEAHAAADDLSSARTSFENAIEAADAGELGAGRARAHEGLAHLALRRGDLAEAERLFRDALASYPQGAGEARNSLVHLDDLESRDLRCLRCIIVPA